MDFGYILYQGPYNDVSSVKSKNSKRSDSGCVIWNPVVCTYSTPNISIKSTIETNELQAQ